MTRKTILAPAGALLVAAFLAGCGGMVQTADGPMPQYCLLNNTATGAGIGGALGAGIGAAVSRGGLGGSLGGALGGMIIGGLIGAQMDSECRQLAFRRAIERAEAQALAAEQAAAQAAAQRRRPIQVASVANQPVYEEYMNPSNGGRRKATVQRLNSYTDPATRQECDTYTKIDSGVDGSGSSNMGTQRRCKGPDGKWQDA